MLKGIRDGMTDKDAAEETKKCLGLDEDSSGVDDKLDEMEGNVMRGIMIEFEPDHYEAAFEVVKFWREQDAYVGKMILDYLQAEKDKLNV